MIFVAVCSVANRRLFIPQKIFKFLKNTFNFALPPGISEGALFPKRKKALRSSLKIEYQIFKEVCRFARNTVDTLVPSREVKNIGVEILFCGVYSKRQKPLKAKDFRRFLMPVRRLNL